MKKNNTTRYFYLINKRFHFRYAGWSRYFNVLPYIVIKANPIRTDWKDYSIECGWLMWAFGVRIEPNYD